MTLHPLLTAGILLAATVNIFHGSRHLPSGRTVYTLFGRGVREGSIYKANILCGGILLGIILAITALGQLP